ncbi:hypothetical protein AKO1_003090 [Acrasis kona]|uniref:IPT/TIG domain-containing protein n=1 Tax=Acrasis kona TaxID=1008807 RepID=A0AAW2Z958_9EUKA
MSWPTGSVGTPTVHKGDILLPKNLKAKSLYHNHEAFQLLYKEENKEFKILLENLFKGACANNTNSTQKYLLPLPRFRILLQDFNILDATLVARDVDLIYVSVTGSGNEMNYDTFVLCMYEVAARKYRIKIRSDKKNEVFITLLESIRDNTIHLPMYLNALPTIKFTDFYNIERLFWINEKALQKIFNEYCELHVSEETLEKSTVLRMENFKKFATVYKFHPNPLSHADVIRFYKSFLNDDEQENETNLFLKYFDFFDLLIRIAIFIFSKPQYNNQYDDDEKKLEALFSHLSEPYARMFGTTMQEDKVDLSVIGIPVVKQCMPSVGPKEGGTEIFIHGSKFDRRLGGVFCRFGKITVKAHDVTANKISVIPPSRDKTGIKKPDIAVEFEQGENRMTHIVNIYHKADIDVFVSNDIPQFSSTSASFTYKDEMPSFKLGPEIVNQMEPLFNHYCKLNDPYNNGLMNLDKWRMYKADMSRIEELGLSRDDQNSSTPSDTDSDDENSSADIDFYKFAKTDRDIGFKLNIQQFLMANVFFILTKTDSHPVDFLIKYLRFRDTLKIGTKVIYSEETLSEEARLWKEINTVLRRQCRSFDVYSGPVLIGKVEERTPGVIIDSDGSVDRTIYKNIQYTQFDSNTESTIKRHISLSESFEHFIRRIINAGFDVAGSNPDPSTSTPVGRCWQEKVGALWDYPGQLSSLNWQPRPGELEHDKITITIYDGMGNARKSDYLSTYQMYGQVNSISMTRDLIEKNGYRLRTALYKAI